MAGANDLEVHISNHPSLLPLDLPATPITATPTGTVQAPRQAVAAPPPEEIAAAVAMPWMGMVAMAVLVALSLAALRLRFSDAPAADRPASWDSTEETPVVPRPSLLFRRSHHEKMHDQRYLSLILEAELESPPPPPPLPEGRRPGSPFPPLGQAIGERGTEEGGSARFVFAFSALLRNRHLCDCCIAVSQAMRIRHMSWEVKQSTVAGPLCLKFCSNSNSVFVMPRGGNGSSRPVLSASGGSPEFGQAALPSPEGLIALDHLCWLGSGREVAQRMNCNPSTVSRKAEACAVNLGLLLRKRAGIWTLFGDGDLLQGERCLHQRYRLAGYGPLRLEISADLSELLASPPSRSWVSGGQRHFDCRRPLELLEQRVTDAWLCSFCEELPCHPDTCWLVLDITRLPLQLLAHKDHPLLAKPASDGVDGDALRSCPCLALPDHCQSNRQALLRRLGLANQLLSLERHDPAKWDEPLDDRRTIRAGTPFDLRQYSDWRPLPLPLEHEVRLGLVIRKDLVEVEPVQELHLALQDWCRAELS